jgi:hypothetical protein
MSLPRPPFVPLQNSSARRQHTKHMSGPIACFHFRASIKMGASGLLYSCQLHKKPGHGSTPLTFKCIQHSQSVEYLHLVAHITNQELHVSLYNRCVCCSAHTSQCDLKQSTNAMSFGCFVASCGKHIMAANDSLKRRCMG